MCQSINSRTHFPFLLLLIIIVPQILCAPRHNLDSKRELEKTLDTFLKAYYDEVVAKQSELPRDIRSGQQEGRSISTTSIYDQMQGDQPDMQNGVSGGDGSDEFTKNRDRFRKENWVEYLKSQILNHLGRPNTTFTKPPEDPPLSDINITQIIPEIFNTTGLDDDQITEKIRSFYPSCEPNQNQDQESQENMMYLNFDLEYNTDSKNSTIASATLRLYRLPQNGTNKFNPKKDDCKPGDSTEDEKLLRVSVYWHNKGQKKRRVPLKRRLADSKVVPDSARWVELSVKPATKAWNKTGTRTASLAISVEDQDGKQLKADRYFKGASCMVGVSTPKPIPTIVRDASHVQADELDRIHSVSGRNSTSTVHSHLLLLPTVDICYLEFPEQTDISHYDSARINACNLRKIHEEHQRQAERERIERLATLKLPRHIRHQRQHRQIKLAADDVSEFESNLRRSNNKQIILTREQLEEYQRNRGLNR